MLKKSLAVFLMLFFAFSVLLISILRTASVKHIFHPLKDNLAETKKNEIHELEKIELDYYLAYSGPVLPDSPFWKFKALRDKIWLAVTTNKSKKIEINLLFADKRLMAAKKMFDRKKYELGYTTLTKAEKYLERASAMEREERKNTNESHVMAERLEKASLMHILVIKEIILISPEDAIPKLIILENYPQNVYKDKVDYLKSQNCPFINNPFDGE